MCRLAFETHPRVQDWWNSPSVEAFCRGVRALCWSALVRLWTLAKRAPRAKARFAGAVLLCFLTSAVVHKLLLAVAARAWCIPYAALGMMGQVRTSRRAHARLRARLCVPAGSISDNSQGIDPGSMSATLHVRVSALPF